MKTTSHRPKTPEEARNELLAQLQRYIPVRTAGVSVPDGTTTEVDTNQSLREALASFIIADRQKLVEALRFPIVLGSLEELDVLEGSVAVGTNGVRLVAPTYLLQRRIALSNKLRGLCNGEV